MGKSGHIASKIAATMASTGTPAFFVHPGEASHGDLGMVTDSDVVLLLSNSGETEEILTIVPVLKRQGNPIRSAMTGPAELAPGAAGRRAPGRQRRRGSLPARPGADLQHHHGAGAGRRARRWPCSSRAASPPTTSRARTRPARSAAACCCTSPTSCTPAWKCRAWAQGASASEALVEMTRGRLGMTAVVDAEDRLLGVFTDGDLRRALDDASLDLRATPVRGLMAHSPKTIGAHALAVEAAHLMEEHKINALLVGRRGRPRVGALNIHDLLRARVV
jgi:arabinose-5-phosphate isomerase